MHPSEKRDFCINVGANLAGFVVVGILFLMLRKTTGKALNFPGA